MGLMNNRYVATELASLPEMFVEDQVFGCMHEAALLILEALRPLSDWGESGVKHTQYIPDLISDSLLRGYFEENGYRVLSEESGYGSDTYFESNLSDFIIIDPIDGSTNASLGLPWYATSLCYIQNGIATHGYVANLALGDVFVAKKDNGAFHCVNKQNRPNSQLSISHNNAQTESNNTLNTVYSEKFLYFQMNTASHNNSDIDVNKAIIAISGVPAPFPKWAQFRCYGSISLDLCAVASGNFDGYVDCSFDAHGIWDYAAAVLICEESGVFIQDSSLRPLFFNDLSQRRTPIAAASKKVFDYLVAYRTTQFNL